MCLIQKIDHDIKEYSWPARKSVAGNRHVRYSCDSVGMRCPCILHGYELSLLGEGIGHVVGGIAGGIVAHRLDAVVLIGIAIAVSFYQITTISAVAHLFSPFPQIRFSFRFL